MTMMSTGTPGSGPVKTSIAPWLPVSRATEAVNYYKAAFGAVEQSRLFIGLLLIHYRRGRRNTP